MIIRLPDSFIHQTDDDHDDEGESGYYEHTDAVQDRFSDEGPL